MYKLKNNFSNPASTLVMTRVENLLLSSKEYWSKAKIKTTNLVM